MRYVLAFLILTFSFASIVILKLPDKNEYMAKITAKNDYFFVIISDGKVLNLDKGLYHIKAWSKEKDKVDIKFSQFFEVKESRNIVELER